MALTKIEINSFEFDISKVKSISFEDRGLFLSFNKEDFSADFENSITDQSSINLKFIDGSEIAFEANSSLYTVNSITYPENIEEKQIHFLDVFI